MVLIWHEGALGDLLISRLALGALREKHPHEEIVLFARSEARYLLLKAGLVDQAYPTSLAVAQRFKNVARLYLFAQRPEAFSFLNPLAQTMVSVSTRPLRPQHLALQELEALGFWPSRLALFLQENKAMGRKVILHPGSGGRFKCAPPSTWRTLGALLKKEGFQISFLLGPAEKDLLKEFASEETILSEDLKGAVEQLNKAPFFIGHDSGLSHLAAALGLYTFCLFGPTAWWHWAPFGYTVAMVKRCQCLEKGLDPHHCPQPCLSEIRAEELARIFLDLSTTARWNHHLPKASGYDPGFVDNWGSVRKKAVEPQEAVVAEEEPRDSGKSGVPELGIQVVEVGEEHFPKG